MNIGCGACSGRGGAHLSLAPAEPHNRDLHMHSPACGPSKAWRKTENHMQHLKPYKSILKVLKKHSCQNQSFKKFHLTCFDVMLNLRTAACCTELFWQKMFQK
jgi:hypothetical protein